ncbi:protein THEMIS [Tachysurus vachellii]|uniref:protein THEMIS n=1 Tax=Tachysurus vachellii TaxID=175792 RepID=UPI00296B455D|nr:protein THEMIS [Tachysurus vachellii]
MMAMTLSEFTRSLDPETLPRILQIQSGIYCPGSVYELFGRACSLSTGELVKIIDITITRFIAQTSDGTEIILPLDYPGLFRIVADSEPYLSIQEIVHSLKIGDHVLGQPVFVSSGKITLPQGSLKKRESFRITSVLRDLNGGEDRIVCEVLHREPKFCFTLGFSQKGNFTECEDDQFYTLQELAKWKIPNGRQRIVTIVKDLPVKDLLFSNLLENVCGELTLSPVYELQAVTSVGKDKVVIPSNLDVEVMEVTDQIDTSAFIQPLSLQDVFQKPCEIFPFVAEVIESPTIEVNMPEEMAFLSNCKQIIVHCAYKAKRILATEIRQESPKHFLIPSSYNGRLKRRPREFPTSYDLKRAQSNTENMHVVATRAFDSVYDGLASVLVGDEFQVKKKEPNHIENRDTTEFLKCLKIKGKSQEVVRLPMFIDGGFMEVIHDKRQYSISEICHWFPLPFNVKVSVRDLSLKEDILAGAPGLRIEEEIIDPYLLVSSTDLSSWWEISVNRTHMTLHMDKTWNGGEPPSGVTSFVEMISEKSYYTMRRYAVATVTPPPRPPKTPKRPPERPIRTQQTKSEKTSTCSPKLTVKSREGPTDCNTAEMEKNTIIPATLPRMTAQTAVSRGHSLEDVCVNQAKDDDAHDYEYIDEDELEKIRKQFSEQSISISAKDKPSNTI